MTTPALGVEGPTAPTLTYPLLFRRYLGTLIDGLFVLATILVVPQFLQGSSTWFQSARIALFLGIFLYEPVLTAFACTLGQRLMKMRVRRADDPSRRITLPAAYVRYIVKGFLGVISFFSMRVTNRYRALHDMAAGSIMIDVT